MKKTYTTAQGKQVSIDTIRLSNESVIAVGNQKVNAKGETLGPGGVPMATRQQTVNQYYNLHTPTAGMPQQGVVADALTPDPNPSADPLIDEQDSIEVVPEPVKPPMRGSLADAVAKTTRVKK